MWTLNTAVGLEPFLVLGTWFYFVQTENLLFYLFQHLQVLQYRLQEHMSRGYWENVFSSVSTLSLINEFGAFNQKNLGGLLS